MIVKYNGSLGNNIVNSKLLTIENQNFNKTHNSIFALELHQKTPSIHFQR